MTDARVSLDDLFGSRPTDGDAEVHGAAHRPGHGATTGDGEAVDGPVDPADPADPGSRTGPATAGPAPGRDGDGADPGDEWRDAATGRVVSIEDLSGAGERVGVPDPAVDADTGPRTVTIEELTGASAPAAAPSDGPGHDGDGPRRVSVERLTGRDGLADPDDDPAPRVASFEELGGSRRRPVRGATRNARGPESEGGERGERSERTARRDPDRVPAVPGDGSSTSDARRAGPPAHGDDADEGGSGRRRGGRPRRGDRERSTGRAGREGRPGAAGRQETPAEQESRAKEICLRLLTDRARTVKELRDALLRKEIAGEVADRVLERFDQVGLVDDTAFAGQWVRSRHHHRGLGKRAIAMELRRKGVEREIADEALTEIDEDSERERARELVSRRLRSLPVGSREERGSTARKLVGMLARKGYGPGVAYGVVKEEIAAAGADADELGEPPPDE